MGTSTATSRVMTHFKQMPHVISGSDMSCLVEIIIHMTIFEFYTQKPAGDHAWSTKVIIELYHIQISLLYTVQLSIPIPQPRYAPVFPTFIGANFCPSPRSSLRGPCT